MPNDIISQVELPDGTVYDVKDTVSGYGTGTVTSITAGTGLTVATGNSNPITTSGTIKTKLNSETSLGTIGTTSKLYAVGVDSAGKLAVSVPWKDVSFSRSLSTGTQIGSITIDGTTTVIYAPSGGGGGSSSTVFTDTVTLESSDWSNNSQTVSVQGVTTTNAVIVTAAPGDVSTWSSCQIACTGQSSGALTFSCSTTPSGDVDANVLIITDLALIGNVLYPYGVSSSE